MATYTEKYNLKKPDETDFVDIADINENMDKIEAALNDLANSNVGILPRLDITTANGVTVTVTDGITTLSGISTGIVSFDLPNFGDWSIEAGNYFRTVKVDTVKIYEIVAIALQDASWQEISAISENGIAPELWKIGDEKDITIDNETLTLPLFP